MPPGCFWGFGIVANFSSWVASGAGASSGGEGGHPDGDGLGEKPRTKKPAGFLPSPPKGVSQLLQVPGGISQQLFQHLQMSLDGWARTPLPPGDTEARGEHRRLDAAGTGGHPGTAPAACRHVIGFLLI